MYLMGFIISSSEIHDKCVSEKIYKLINYIWSCEVINSHLYLFVQIPNCKKWKIVENLRCCVWIKWSNVITEILYVQFIIFIKLHGKTSFLSFPFWTKRGSLKKIKSNLYELYSLMITLVSIFFYKKKNFTI